MEKAGKNLLWKIGLGSMKSRMLFSFVGMVLLATLTIAVYVGNEVVLKTITLQNRHAQNLLHTVLLNVESEYKDYCLHRTSLIEERKKKLSHISEIAFNQINSLYSLVQEGKLDESEAKQRAMDTVRQMRYDDGVGYVWIQNTETPIPRLVMHPTQPQLDGKPGTDPLYYSALDSGQNLLSIFSEACHPAGHNFVEYRWPKPTEKGQEMIVPKVSHVRFFEPWDWVIGTGIYVDDIERESQRRFEEVVEALRQTLKQVKIAETGYMFIIDEQRRVVIHPQFERMKVLTHLNPETGNLVADDLMEASKHPDKPLSYLWNSPCSGDKEHFTYRKKAYVRHFEPLGWYIGASVYEDDIKAPALAMQRRILWITCGFSLGAVGLSVLLATNMSRPLSKLTSAALTIKEDGIDAVNIPLSGPSETRTLGRCLRDMVVSLGNALREKEELLIAKQSSEEDLRITLNSIMDAVIATDQTGRIVRMNPTAEMLTEWNVDEAIKHPLEEVVHIISPITNKTLRNPVEDVLESGHPYSTRERAFLMTHTGNKYTISYSATPIHSQGGTLRGAVLVFQDITQELALQEQLQHSQKMDAIGQLTGGIAHDFNNMLGGILGAAELSNFSLPEDSDVKKNNQLIIDTAKRAAGLTRQLLSFSRRQPTILTKVEVHHLLEEVALLISNTTNRKVSLSMNLNAKHDVVLGDPSQLQSVFMNLGINASDAMKNGGTLTITTNEIELDESHCAASTFSIEPGQYLTISIEDEGVGIPSKDLSRIFEPFFTTKEVGKGTGLGLSAVYGSISQHNGEITVSSEEGVGTCFRISLPLKPVTSAVKKQEAIPVSGHGRILIIEDEKTMRTTAKTLLENLGYEVVVAENGKEGLDIFQQDPESFDLVLLDMIMPEMNGDECFSAMKIIKPDVCVIISSGFWMDEGFKEMRAKGVQDVIDKPYDIVKLSRMIRTTLDRQHQDPSSAEG